jgi:hypothetical protein
MPIEDLPKGAIPDSPDERDYHVSAEILGAVTVDWSKEFRLPNPGDEDQGSSDSCVSQAWSYYHVQLHPKDYSRRDLFARIALSYGAEIRSGGKELVDNGQATRDEVPDPRPQTPQNMRDKTGITPEKQASDKELSYFRLPQADINGVAWGIETYKGVVFGVTGDNAGWRDLRNPQPPAYGTPNTWGHALYAMGHHMHSDGQKCIIAKSSWCNSVKEHHIRENYFITGNTFNAWTLIPREQESMTNSLVVRKGDEYGIYDPATKPDGMISMMRNRGMTPPLKADGTLDFDALDKMVSIRV